MLYIISYDVATTTPAGQKRLRRIARLCENYGVRVQNSVFECVLDYAAFISLKSQMSSIIEQSTDSLRIYPMGKNARDKIIHIGAKSAIDVQAPLIF